MIYIGRRSNGHDRRAVEIRIDHTPRTYRDRKDFAMEAASFLKSRNPHSVVEVRDLKKWRGDGRHLQGRLMPLTMRPAGLSPGIDQDRATTPYSAASGISAASMKSEAAPSICGGFGRCTSPASRSTYAQITAWPRWRRPRRSFKRAGMSGKRGRRWRKLSERPLQDIRIRPAPEPATTIELAASTTRFSSWPTPNARIVDDARRPHPGPDSTCRRASARRCAGI